MITLLNQELAVKMYGKAMKEEGRIEGIKEGIEEGRIEATNKISQLIAKLLSLGKVQDLEKASKDPNYMQQLLKDYGLVED